MYIYKTVASFAATMTRYVAQSLRRGLHGWRVTDCVVTMNQCGYSPRPPRRPTSASSRPLVLMAALEQAGTVVCEPMTRVSLEIPADPWAAVLAAVARLGGAAERQRPARR